MGQTTIFNFVDAGKSAKLFVVIEDLPEFVDVDLSTKGPYKKGDIITRGEVTDRMLEILLQRGAIIPPDKEKK